MSESENPASFHDLSIIFCYKASRKRLALRIPRLSY